MSKLAKNCNKLYDNKLQSFSKSHTSTKEKELSFKGLTSTLPQSNSEEVMGSYSVYKDFLKVIYFANMEVEIIHPKCL
jgi:hypothetical protein